MCTQITPIKVFGSSISLTIIDLVNIRSLPVNKITTFREAKNSHVKSSEYYRTQKDISTTSKIPCY